MPDYTVAGGPEFEILNAPITPPAVDEAEGRRRAEIFLRLPSLVSYEQPMSEILATLARHIVENTTAVSAAVNLIRPSDASTIALGYHNLPVGYLEAMEAARQSSIQGEWLRERARLSRTWVLRQAKDYMLSRPEYAHMRDLILQCPFDTLIGTPFSNRPEAMGFVFLYYPAGVEVADSEIDFARAVAEYARPLMDNAWLFSETRRRAAELEALSKADEALHESLDLDDVFQAMSDLAVNLLGADRSLLLAFNDQNRLHAHAVRGMPEAELAALQEIYHGIDRSRFVNSTPELVVMEDVRGSSVIHPSVQKVTSSASSVDVPVFVRGEFFCIFVVSYYERRTFSEDDRRLFRTFATRAGLAVQNALQFRETQRRARELEALHRADEALHQSLLPENVEEAMVDLAAGLLGADFSAVVTWNEAADRMKVVASRGMSPRMIELVNQSYARFDRAHFEKFQAPYKMGLVENTQQSPAVEEPLKGRTPGSFAEIPVVVDEKIWGLFSVGWNRVRTFSEADKKLFDAFASRASLAIQNALLFRETQRRSSELEALYHADEALHRSLNLEDVLQAMVDLSAELLGASSSLVVSWDEADRLALRATRGIDRETQATINARYQEITRDTFAGRDGPVPIGLVERVQGHPRIRLELQSGPRSLAEIPVMVANELWGFFSIGWRQQRSFTESDSQLFDAFAARASLAVQNALLYEQAQKSASMEERQRIARELHDSVSQALYGIGLGARTARRRLGDGAAADILEPVDYIVQLAESGLAETRALIFELVPESLEQQGLVLALQRQAAATKSRHRIEVASYLCDEPELPIRSKEALYRIAQESLHNMAKHAQATNAVLTLAADDSTVTLIVEDNGRGFDTAGEFPGHFGLRSMEERARRIGGAYSIASELGLGTTVTVSVPF